MDNIISNEIYTLTNEEIESFDIDRFLIDDDTEVEDDKILLKMNNSNIMRENNITAITAQAGVGKTTFCSGLIEALLKFDDDRCINVPAEENVLKPSEILYVDTEQSRGDSKKTFLKTKVKGEGSIKYLSIKGDYNENKGERIKMNAINRMKCIEIAILKYKPKVLFLDGVTDLTQSVNDEKEAKIITDWLTNLAELRHMCIVCVIHQNEGNSTENVKLRGWLGAEITRKADCTISLTRCKEDTERLKATTTKVRGSRPATIEYRITEEEYKGKMYAIADFYTSDDDEFKEDKAIMKIMENLRVARIADTEFTRKDYQERCKVSTRTAIEHLRMIKDRGKIKECREVGQTKYYRIIKF